MCGPASELSRSQYSITLREPPGKVKIHNTMKHGKFEVNLLSSICRFKVGTDRKNIAHVCTRN